MTWERKRKCGPNGIEWNEDRKCKVKVKEKGNHNTFQSNRGLYELLIMFFGLTNSPATFQTMMDRIFKDLISKGVVVVYLDDILIFTKTLEEH